MTDQSSEILKVGEDILYIRFAQPLEHLFENTMTAAKYWNLTPTFTSENRGYGGTWEVKDNALYLVSIYACRRQVTGFWFWKKVTFPEVTVTDLFPHALNGEIKAIWFTGSFSAYTKSMKNPVDDRLSVRFEKGNLTHYQWFHLDGNGDKNAIPYNKALP
jgi:hypothetical protein